MCTVYPWKYSCFEVTQMHCRRLLFGMISVALIVPPVSAQITHEELLTATQVLQWREIGPTIMSGRISDIAVVEANPSIFYLGTATGGIWKTENAGTTFEPLFQGEETSSIGDVTVSQSNPNIVWAGTGEPQNRQSSPWGNGVYRSTDAGASWANVGLENTHHISRIQVHPMNPDVAYVAAVGHLWGSNPERGVYKTTDGGQNWEHVLFVDEHTGTIDLVMDPNDPMTLFAAMYQRQRRAWGFNGGGPGSGIYRTVDGGASWIELTDGLPIGDKGRIGLDVYRGDGNLVCALVEADARTPGQGRGGGPGQDEQKNGVYCSRDRGDNWEQMSTTNNRPMYYSQIRIDPNDPERIYLGGSDLYRSSDGGRTFTNDAAAGVHLDHHALWIDPSNSDHLILGSDGGLSVSWDRSDNWYQFRNLPIAQFYEIGIDSREPYHVCGGLQDNGSWCAPSDTWSNQGIRTRDWYNVGSGDGFFTVMHPVNPNVMFAESQGGNLTRVDLTTMERSRIRPIGQSNEDGEQPDLRWNWDSPIVLSAHDENTVYAGANVLFRSRDLGQTWDQISPDLTYEINRDSLSIMGVLGSEPQMSLNDGQSSYGNLTAIGESPLNGQVIYTGSDDGRVQITQDAGDTWTDLTDDIEGLPDNVYVTRIVASHADEGTVYIAFDNHRSDDFAPYLFISTDFGREWRAAVSGLPQSSLNALAQHPRNPNLMFVGNEVGVYASVNSGGQWVRLENGLPTVPVDDIKIEPRENDLVIGTHGRGIWIMDDITPLEELTPEAITSEARLFGIQPAVSYNLYTPQGWTPGIFSAPNPPMGARMRYHLAEAPDEVSLSITDLRGQPIRKLEGTGNAGLNEVIWDLRIQEESSSGDLMNPGPRVLPGTYLVQLEAGSSVLEGEFSVRLDPRVDISQTALLARQDAMISSYRLSGVLSEANSALADLEEQLEGAMGLLDEVSPESEDLKTEIERLLGEVDQVDNDLGESGRGANLVGQIEGVTGAPTADQLLQIEESWDEIPALIDRLNTLITAEVPALYARLDDAGIRPNPGSAIEMPRRRR